MPLRVRDLQHRFINKVMKTADKQSDLLTRNRTRSMMQDLSARTITNKFKQDDTNDLAFSKDRKKLPLVRASSTPSFNYRLPDNKPIQKVDLIRMKRALGQAMDMNERVEDAAASHVRYKSEVYKMPSLNAETSFKSVILK